MAYGAIYRKTLNLNSRVKARLAVLLGVTLVTAACATGPLWSPPPEGAADPRATAPEFTFVSDTFAFANLIRARHRGEDDLYANYCFVLARGLRQFSQFARFDPALPRLDHDGYAGLVRRVVPLLVTNWPKPELNHTVVAFESRDAGSTVDFVVWDPNDPDAPGIVTFDRHAGRFWATRVYDTEPGAIRVFRMYYSRLL